MTDQKGLKWATPDGDAAETAVAGFVRPLIPVVLAIVTFLAFLPSLWCGFANLDDGKLIAENPAFRGLSWEHLRWMAGATLLGHWHPLTWLSFAIDYQLAGLKPYQYHLTNVLFHAANAPLLYAVILRLLRATRGLERGTASRLAAAAGTLLWSVHPLRVESVTWITERRDVLSGFFLLLTVLAYLRACPAGTGRAVASWGWYAASIGLLALSLLSKAWGMSFFAVAIVLDWYPLRRLPASPSAWLKPDAWPVLAQKMPYFALGLASAWIAGMAQRSSGATHGLEDWPLASRIAQACYGLVFYPWKTLWPTRLCILYDLPNGLNPLRPKYLACYAGLIAAVTVAVVLRRRAPWLGAAAAVYAICVAPVLGFLQSGDQFVADRYSYIACVPWSVLAAGLLAAAAGRVKAPLRAWVLAAPAAPALVLAWATWTQAWTWRDPVPLWRQAVEAEPMQLASHVNYGYTLDTRAKELEKQGRVREAGPLYEEALEHFRIATRLDPLDWRGWFPLANALRRKGEFAGAEGAYREAAKSMPQAYLPLVNLGFMLQRDLNRPDDALKAFREAVESVEHPRPGSFPSARPHLALGRALRDRGDTQGAGAAFTRALELAIQRQDSEAIQQARAELASLGNQK